VHTARATVTESTMWPDDPGRWCVQPFSQGWGTGGARGHRAGESGRRRARRLPKGAPS